MRKEEIARGPGGRVIVIDSIGQLAAGDAGAIVVSGSHGGSSAGSIAAEVPLRLVFFNDAGGGKDNAGISSLPMLQARGTAAATVAHTSARIGEARSTLHDGVVSHCNAQALSLGIEPGQACAALIRQLQGSGG